MRFHSSSDKLLPDGKHSPKSKIRSALLSLPKYKYPSRKPVEGALASIKV